MKHYVYIHFTKDELRPFYIGKGKDGRKNVSSGRNRFWKRIVAKHGFVSDYLKHFETHEDALKYEMGMISFFKQEGYELANLTEGGDGQLGSNWNLGSKRTPEQCKRISESQKGRQFSDEHRQKMSEARRKKDTSGENNPTYKGPVTATNRDTGEQIILHNQKEMRDLGFSPEIIYNCLSGRRKHNRNHTFTR
jgi:hypothetical protein